MGSQHEAACVPFLGWGNSGDVLQGWNIIGVCELIKLFRSGYMETEPSYSRIDVFWRVVSDQ